MKLLRRNGSENELFKVKSHIKFWVLVILILHNIEIEPAQLCKWYVSPLWRGFLSVSPSFFVGVDPLNFFWKALAEIRRFPVFLVFREAGGGEH